MTKLEALSKAIEHHEGFYPGSHSWRNANPGNLRASPFSTKTDGGYATFDSYTLGWFALTWDLQHKCSGKTTTGLSGVSTLRDLITVWAPPKDGNDTEKYIKDVSNFLNLPDTTQLSYFLD